MRGFRLQKRPVPYDDERALVGDGLFALEITAAFPFEFRDLQLGPAPVEGLEMADLFYAC